MWLHLWDTILMDTTQHTRPFSLVWFKLLSVLGVSLGLEKLFRVTRGRFWFLELFFDSVWVVLFLESYDEFQSHQRDSFILFTCKLHIKQKGGLGFPKTYLRISYRRTFWVVSSLLHVVWLLGFLVIVWWIVFIFGIQDGDRYTRNVLLLNLSIYTLANVVSKRFYLTRQNVRLFF